LLLPLRLPLPLPLQVLAVILTLSLSKGKNPEELDSPLPSEPFQHMVLFASAVVSSRHK
jgi:hypothetical protein